MVRRVETDTKAPWFSRVSAAAVCCALCITAACMQGVLLPEMFEQTPSLTFKLNILDCKYFLTFDLLFNKPAPCAARFHHGSQKGEGKGPFP